jgi:hypothetical protein
VHEADASDRGESAIQRMSEIEADSTFGEGTTFRVALPLAG